MENKIMDRIEEKNSLHQVRPFSPIPCSFEAAHLRPVLRARFVRPIGKTM